MIRRGLSQSWASRRTITWLSASRVTLSTVDEPRNNRAQAPCSRGARMIRSASCLRATFRIAPAGVPSSTTQVATTPACFARFMAGSIPFSASQRRASKTHVGDAGPKGITLGKIAWQRTSFARVCPARLAPTRTASREAGEKSKGTTMTIGLVSPPASRKWECVACPGPVEPLACALFVQNDSLLGVPHKLCSRLRNRGSSIACEFANQVIRPMLSVFINGTLLTLASRNN